MISSDDIDLKTLRLFIDVYHALNFSVVARREGVSASKISRMIHQLEDALGQQLFYRSTRAIVPTEAGHILVSYAERVLAELNKAETELNNRALEPTGIIRINGPVFFGQSHIAPWLADLSARYPRLSFELTLTDDYIDPHREGVDLTFRIGLLADSSVHAHVFTKQTYYLAASPRYIETFGEPADSDVLVDHDCLVYKGSEGPNRWFFKQSEQSWQQMPIKPLLASNNAESLLRAALDGMGIVLFPDWLIGQYLGSGELVRLLTSHECAIKTEDQYVAAIYPNSRHPSTNVRAVIDYFSEVYGEPPYWQEHTFQQKRCGA